MEGDVEIEFISNSFYCEVRGFISDINYNNKPAYHISS